MKIAEMVAEAVHAAVAPIARQQTEWIQRERRRLEQTRRTWTGRAAATGGAGEESNRA